MATSFIRLFMPQGGEAGVIIATNSNGERVEFRGSAYSTWTEHEDSAMFRLHSALKRVNISNLHADGIETVTPWHPEWTEVETLFDSDR